jgi:hypothetical protein
MTNAAKTTKAEPAAKPAAKSDPAPKAKIAPAEGSAKTDGGETAAAAPSGYSRGEGQKPVTRAYKENWNTIFAKKSKKANARKPARNKR